MSITTIECLPFPGYPSTNVLSIVVVKTIIPFMKISTYGSTTMIYQREVYK